MGKRGPPAKPTALKKLEGTFRKDRAVPNELELPPGIPDRPDWLDAEGRREWDRVVPQLAERGILTDVDRAMLADYCAAHSLAVNATRKYQKQGLTVKSAFGPQKNPLIKVAQEARSQAKQLAAEFGLSAASRTRISMPEKPKQEDKTESFLFGGPRLVSANDGTK